MIGSLVRYSVHPKPAYQPSYGIEVMTRTEVIRQWVDCLLRPDSRVLRGGCHALPVAGRWAMSRLSDVTWRYGWVSDVALVQDIWTLCRSYVVWCMRFVGLMYLTSDACKCSMQLGEGKLFSDSILRQAVHLLRPRTGSTPVSEVSATGIRFRTSRAQSCVSASASPQM